MFSRITSSHFPKITSESKITLTTGTIFQNERRSDKRWGKPQINCWHSNTTCLNNSSSWVEAVANFHNQQQRLQLLPSFTFSKCYSSSYFIQTLCKQALNRGRCKLSSIYISSFVNMYHRQLDHLDPVLMVTWSMRKLVRTTELELGTPCLEAVKEPDENWCDRSPLPVWLS